VAYYFFYRGDFQEGRKMEKGREEGNFEIPGMGVNLLWELRL